MTKKKEDQDLVANIIRSRNKGISQVERIRVKKRVDLELEEEKKIKSKIKNLLEDINVTIGRIMI